MILGIPCIGTTDAYISCRSGSMTIYDGSIIKNLTLYPPSKLIIDVETPLWMDLEEEEDIQSLLTIGKSLTFKTETEDDTIYNFISEPMYVTKIFYQIMDNTMEEQEREKLIEETLVSSTELIPVIDHSKSVPVELDLGKTMNINPNLKIDKMECLVTLLEHNKGYFSWEYTNMIGIPSELCMYHIYIKNDSKPVHQPQHRMNLNLRDIVKEEIQKLLEEGFIYPISDNEWVSTLVTISKKNGKW